jgi:hypothetical protein
MNSGFRGPSIPFRSIHHLIQSVLSQLKFSFYRHQPIRVDFCEFFAVTYALGIPANCLFKRRAQPRQKQLQQRYRRTNYPLGVQPRSKPCVPSCSKSALGSAILPAASAFSSPPAGPSRAYSAMWPSPLTALDHPHDFDAELTFLRQSLRSLAQNSTRFPTSVPPTNLTPSTNPPPLDALLPSFSSKISTLIIKQARCTVR